MRHRIEFADNLIALAEIPSSSVPLIYIDPPFNTGKQQRRTTTRTTSATDGDRTGFAGRQYRTTRLGTSSYADAFDDYLLFLEPRLREAYRVLTPKGTLYVHLDPREVHYVKILLDEIFGRASFLNEIIWVYDYGGRPRDRWPAKHDNILVYVKDPKNYVFNADDVDREPYMAPGLVTPEKAALGKRPTDSWWHTIVSPTGKEKTGYPTQKPIGVLKRIVTASSHPDDVVLDFFAGSGTTGAAALALGRRFHLIDNNPQAIAIMAQRFTAVAEVEFVATGSRH
ncbi:MAG: adenine-specific DNA-methyltransferase [Thermomicrobiales bacterium]|nr:adenine-specific DNA-methyltransferase [Thermomicrobiales bacterium]